MIFELNLENLKSIDAGIVDAQFAKCLSRVVEDCVDRPGVKSKREVSLVLSLEPEVDEAGQCDSVAASFQIKTKMPNYASKVYQCKPRTKKATGGDIQHVLAHNDLSPDNVHQNTLDLENDNG